VENPENRSEKNTVHVDIALIATSVQNVDFQNVDFQNVEKLMLSTFWASS
jgi:mannitol/fructose-specific phosphotransferase system IIA component (Ntr-type)